MNKPNKKIEINFDNEEEKFRQLNKELEAKGETLLRNTEALLENHEKFMQRPASSMCKKETSATQQQENTKLKQKMRLSSRASDCLTSRETSNQPDTKNILEEVAPKTNDDYEDDDEFNEILPPSTRQMGSEAQLRFMKAKLKAIHEELTSVSKELKLKDADLRSIQSKVKKQEEEKEKIKKVNSTLEAQIEKIKKESNGWKEEKMNLELQLVASKKEIEELQKSEKHKVISSGGMESKLNRALEECNKLKNQIEKLKVQAKDDSQSDRKLVEQLTASNKQLEKQNSDLLDAYKKQLKLIDVYKRQLVHMEASKMLSFTEEEFMKILDWNKE